MKASDQIAAKLPPVKARKAPRRKPGILHASRAVEIEDVTVRMKKPCAMCASEPKVRRLSVVTGGGRYAKVEVYCIKCGVEFLTKAVIEYERAIPFLQLGFVKGATDPSSVRV